MLRESLVIFTVSSTLVGTTVGNEALDYIEGVQNSSTGWGSYIPYSPSTSTATSSGAKAKAPPSEDYSTRWPLNTPPLVTPYRSEDNPYVQEFSVTGLYEWQAVDGRIKRDDGQRTGVRGTGARRARLGAMVKAFYNTEVEASVLVDGDGDYEGIDKLQATVDLTENTAVRMGKFRPPFSLEYSQDPSVRWTPEMSALTRQIAPGNSLGVLFAGMGQSWDWALGYFGGDLNKNLPGIGSDGYLLGKLAYTTQGGGSEAAMESFQRFHLDYLYNFDPTRSETVPLGYRHLFATGIQVSSGNFDFLGDFMLAHGDTNKSWGLTLMGAYWLVEDAIRLVGRYHYAASDDINGITAGYGIPDGNTDTLSPQNFPIGVGGNELHSFYGGLNFHLLDNNLLLNTGVEYQKLDNNEDEELSLDSLIWQAGGRFAF